MDCHILDIMWGLGSQKKSDHRAPRMLPSVKHKAHTLMISDFKFQSVPSDRCL